MSFFCYEIGRRIFSLGLRVRPILKALQIPEQGARILDAACGYGHFCKYLRNCDYVGMDSDPERIEWAKKLFTENEKRKFFVGSVCQTSFSDKSFDAALGYGILHHLSDEECKVFLSELNRLVKGNIVFSEPVYSRYHLINNLLCRLDAGHYVRQKEGYLALCRSFLDIAQVRTFYAHNGLAKFLLITCQPRQEV